MLWRPSPGGTRTSLRQLILAATEGLTASEHLNTLHYAQAMDDNSLFKTILLPDLLASGQHPIVIPTV